MKKLIKKSVATALGVMVLSQGIYANTLPTVGNVEQMAKTDKVLLAKEDVASSIIQLDDIVEKVAKEMKLADGYKVEDTYLNTDDVYLRKIWNIHFQIGEDSINVQADAESGEIIGFDTWERDNKNILKYTRDEVKQTVIEYMNEHYSELKGDIVEIDEMEEDKITQLYRHDEYHNFVYVRKIDGELFLNNFINISVSGVTGKIMALQKRWDEISYKKKSNSLAEEEAIKYFKELSAVKVKYINVYEEEKKILRPVYYFDESKNGLLDANNKKFYLEDDIYGFRDGYGRMGAKENYTTDSDSEEKSSGRDGTAEIIPEKGVISRETAQQIIMKSIGKVTNITDSKIAYSHYRSWHRGEEGKFWNLNIESEEPEFYVNAVINAETKDIMQLRYRISKPENIFTEYVLMYQYGEMTKSEYEERCALLLAAGEITQTQYDNRFGDKNTVDKKAVEEKAKALVIKMFPLLKDEKLTVEVNTEDGKTSVNGVRTIDNIPYYDNGFDMEYDAVTDTFTRITFNWGYDLEIEQPKSIISAEEASNIFFKEVGVEKSLIQLIDKEKEEKDSIIVPQKQLVLVYGLKPYNFRYIDAVTGNTLDYSGEVFEGRSDEVRVFDDIDGHAYERAIKLMNKMGFVRADSETFAPKGVLKKKDAIKWVVLTLQRQYRYIPSASRNYTNIEKLKFKDMDENDPYYRYVQDAVRMGIIEEANYFNKDRNVTMVELLRWIINGMGQKELAESDIFKDIENITSKDDGYVGLARYYKIVDDQSDLKETLTRGKILQILYGFIYELEN